MLKNIYQEYVCQIWKTYQRKTNVTILWELTKRTEYE